LKEVRVVAPIASRHSTNRTPQLKYSEGLLIVDTNKRFNFTLLPERVGALHSGWLPQRQFCAAPAARTRHNRYRLGNGVLDSRARQIIAGRSKVRDGLQIHTARSHYEYVRVNRFHKEKNHPAGYRVTF